MKKSVVCMKNSTRVKSSYNGTESVTFNPLMSGGNKKVAHT